MSQYVMKPAGSFLKKLMPVAVIFAAVVVFYAYHEGWIKGRPTNKTEVPQIGAISGEYKKEVVANAPKVPLPQGDELGGKMFATINIYDWHANSALTYANGGERTLEKSLLGAENLIVKIVHQDDTNVSIKSFIEKAAEYKKSGESESGNFMFTIMGNASVPLIEPLQEALKKIDPSYRAVGIDLIGASGGEDQVIGPYEWINNPELMRGKIMVGVYDDGDAQLGFMFANKVGIPVNFDYHTYNKNSLNIANVSDFITAGKVFLSGRALDSRPVVDDDGRRTGKTTQDFWELFCGPTLWLLGRRLIIIWKDCSQSPTRKGLSLLRRLPQPAMATSARLCRAF